MKSKKVIIGIAIILLFYLFTWVYASTGLLQRSDIDKRDLATWDYDQDGVIIGNDSIVLQGNSGECWVMNHGYTTTPDELRNIALALNREFNDTVYIPRLLGHATIPSNIEKYTVSDWYHQIENIAVEHNCSYLLGSSTGASIVLRYAEEHHPKGVVLSGLALKLEPTYLPAETLIRVLHPIVGYLKRIEPGETIEDPAGKRVHVATCSFPLKGVVELLDFNKQVKSDLKDVDARILFIQGTRDKAADIMASYDAFDQINSEKEFLEIEGSHLVFRDYNKDKAVDAVLKFRAGSR